MTATRTIPATQLRAWAKGMYHLEAAVEMLIRGFGGRFAAEGQPWVRRDATLGDPHYWVAFDQLGEYAEVGPLSGGERRYLAIVASLGGAGAVHLEDSVPGLDRHLLALVLAGISHAAGSQEWRSEGDPSVPWPNGPLTGPMFPWPEG